MFKKIIKYFIVYKEYNHNNILQYKNLTQQNALKKFTINYFSFLLLKCKGY